jgi:hypothetical protein
LGGRDRRISEFEASLVYKVSSRTARATRRNPVSKNQKKKRRRICEKLKLFREFQAKTNPRTKALRLSSVAVRIVNPGFLAFFFFFTEFNQDVEIFHQKQ